jgi:DNA helicase-4
VEYLAYYLFPYRSPFEFATAHDHQQYVRSHELKTLRGERVRSHEHLVIANWLHVNGIAYAYRRAYAYDTATVRHKQYQPDFHLTRHDVYLEHVDVDREGRTPRYVDAARYREAMEWKRALHRRHGTSLVETFHHERAAGTLLGALKLRLRALGVVPRPVPPAAIRAAAEEQRLIEPVARLLGTFLSLYKGNLWTLAEIEAAAGVPADPEHPVRDPARALAFLRVFRRVLARYEARLAAAREIDFNDMIAAATERVEARRYVSRFTHVIVDEFQDLSRGRGRLLRALLAQVPDRRLFCVGDDWQSIYRFTGSDIAQMTHFAAEFGFTRRCDLTVTHRFPRELLDASSHFVQQNPAQLRKSLVTARALGEPAIEIHAPGAGEDAAALLDRVLARIADQAVRDGRAATGRDAAPPAVQLLGRYNFVRPEGWADLQKRHARLALDFLTVHRSKGLEADYTVLLDVVAGKMGFPSEVADDPLLDLVLAGAGAFPNAEERRVFYVALTRARTRCYVLTSARRRSPFVEELEREEYRRWVTRGAGRAGGPSPVCPACGGTLMRLEGQHGELHGCSESRPEGRSCTDTRGVAGAEGQRSTADAAARATRSP